MVSERIPGHIVSPYTAPSVAWLQTKCAEFYFLGLFCPRPQECFERDGNQRHYRVARTYGSINGD
jgi:hypothetical protein